MACLWIYLDPSSQSFVSEGTSMFELREDYQIVFDFYQVCDFGEMLRRTPMEWKGS